MNTVRITRLIKHSAFLATFLGANVLLSACGGGSDSKNTTIASSSSSTSSQAFSSTPVTPAGTGTWPDVKVSADGNKMLKFQWSAVEGKTFYKLFKRANKTSTYEQVGANFTTTTVSDSISVHLTDWINNNYMVQACDSNGCENSRDITIDSAMLTSIIYVKASNAEASDWFGWSLAISADGNTMAVGAPAEASNAVGVNGDKTNNESPTSGAVYVFIKENGNWKEQAYVKASNTAQPNNSSAGSTLPNARFGYQVALSGDGNTLAVTALNEHSPSSGIDCYKDDYIETVSSTNSSGSSISVQRHRNYMYGAVYIFKRTNMSWSETTYVKAVINTKDLNFGSALALSGDGKTLAVATPYESTPINGVIRLNTLSSSSARSCYNYNASNSSSNSSLTFSSSSSSSSSSFSSNSSAISSQGSSTSSVSPGGTGSGGIYIYREVNNTWTEEAFIKGADTTKDDRFGNSIALSADGTLLAVGAPGNATSLKGELEKAVIESDEFVLTGGAVYIFKFTTPEGLGTWSQQTKIKSNYNFLSQEFGFSVALSGDGSTLAVGVPGDWSKATGIESEIPKAGEGIGTDFILAKDFIANQGNSNAYGSTYIYTSNGDTWIRQAYIKASNAKLSYQFGGAVTLSHNGNILAVSSLIESSRAKGINGNEADTGAFYSGAAYLFIRDNAIWKQKSYIKSPNSESQDRFSRALGLDASGESLIISAYKEASNAKNINGNQSNNEASASGAVYIY